MPEVSAEILQKVNSTPALLSLLYDVNLLPEQIDSNNQYCALQAIVIAYGLGVASQTKDE
jgi:hypothetical protein